MRGVGISIAQLQKKTLRQLDETLGCAVQRRERMRASDELKSDRHLCCAIFIVDVVGIRVCALSRSESVDMRTADLDTVPSPQTAKWR